MDTPRRPSPPQPHSSQPHSPPPRPARQAPWRLLVSALALLPAGLCALAAACAGRDTAARRLLRAEAAIGAAPGTRKPDARKRSAPRLALHALLTVLLGTLAWVLAGMAVLAVVRGLFYGFVDDGPYDDAWGGPGRAGAWLAHFAIGTPLALVGAGLICGLAVLHTRLTAPLRGEARPLWVLPVVLVSGAAGALFVTAWLRQLG